MRLCSTLQGMYLHALIHHVGASKHFKPTGEDDSNAAAHQGGAPTVVFDFLIFKGHKLRILSC